MERPARTHVLLELAPVHVTSVSLATMGAPEANDLTFGIMALVCPTEREAVRAPRWRLTRRRTSSAAKSEWFPLVREGATQEMPVAGRSLVLPQPSPV